MSVHRHKQFPSLNYSPSIAASVCRAGGDQVFPCTVVYRSPPGRHFDVALIQDPTMTKAPKSGHTPAHVEYACVREGRSYVSCHIFWNSTPGLFNSASKLLYFILYIKKNEHVIPKENQAPFLLWLPLINPYSVF